MPVFVCLPSIRPRSSNPGTLGTDAGMRQALNLPLPCSLIVGSSPQAAARAAVRAATAVP